MATSNSLPGGVSAGGGICELVLESSDIQFMVEFYACLGLEVLSDDGDRVWLATGPRSRLGIWSPGEKEHSDRGGAHVHFALSIGRGRIDEIADMLRSRGAEIEGPVEHEGGDRSLYLFDPEDNRVELWDFFAGDGADNRVDALED